MPDSWKDVQGRAIIIFLVSCPCGLYFVSSIDVTDIIKDAANLFKLLDKVVEEMVEESLLLNVKRFLLRSFCLSSIIDNK